VNKTTVAQCIEGTRPQPFISDQAAYLDRYRSIVLTRHGIFQPGWNDTPIVTAYPTGRRSYGVPGDFSSAIKKYEPRLLHAHHGMFAPDFLALKRKTGLPLIVSFYGFDASGFPNSSPENSSKLRQLFKDAALIVAMSTDMKNDLQYWGCPVEKIVIHRTGVDLERFRYRPPLELRSRTTLLCVCDYSPKKGVLELLAAFKLAFEEFKHLQLRIVGSPITIAKEEYARALEYIEHNGLTNNVTLVPRVDYFQIPEEYQQADLFILPSVTAPDGSKEGVPAVLMEAQSTGLPVISTYHAGISEVVLDGKSGYLVKEHDVISLVSSICQLLNEREKWEAFGRCGREWMEKQFDIRQSRQDLERIYDLVVGNRPNPVKNIL